MYIQLNFSKRRQMPFLLAPPPLHPLHCFYFPLTFIFLVNYFCVRTKPWTARQKTYEDKGENHLDIWRFWLPQISIHHPYKTKIEQKASTIISQVHNFQKLKYISLKAVNLLSNKNKSNLF